jgi:hypothetical protein
MSFNLDEAKAIVDSYNEQTRAKQLQMEGIMKMARKYYADSMRNVINDTNIEDRAAIKKYVENRLLAWPV